MRLPLDPSLVIASHQSLAEPRRLLGSGYLATLNASKVKTSLCVAVALVSMTGCRSSTPKFNMFGFKREPSADALAGVGPTTTYPVSPSTGVSPEAIASAAAGTAAPSGLKPQTSNIAAVPPDSGQLAGASLAGTSATNSAAAAANGFYGTNDTNTSVTATPASYANATGMNSGYTDGRNPSASKSLAGTPAIPAGYVPDKPGQTTPSQLPGYAQSGTTATTPAYSAVPGYPLPGSTSPATTPVASIAATPSQYASASPSTVTPTAPTTNAVTAFAMPPLDGGPVSTAPASMPPASSGFTLPAGAALPAATVASLPSSQLTTSPSPPAPSTGGYKPGSTANASAYPSGDYPSTGQSDTFYR